MRLPNTMSEVEYDALPEGIARRIDTEFRALAHQVCRPFGSVVRGMTEDPWLRDRKFLLVPH